MDKTAVILAAGRAERMMPLSARRLKPMFLLAGKPVIQHALEEARRLGCKEAIVVTPAGDTSLRAFINDGAAFGLSVEYVEQGDETGTLAALRAAEPKLAGACIVLPGGTYIGAGAAKPLSVRSETSLLVAPATATHAQFTPIVRGGKLQKVVLEEATIRATRVSTSIALLGADFMAWLKKSDRLNGSLEDALAAYAGEGEVHVADADGIWEPIVDPWDVVRINERALQEEGVRVGNGVDIHETAVLNPPVWIGDGVHIGEHCVIGPYVSIRTNSRIGALAEIRRSIINNNVQVDTRAVIRDSILDDGFTAGPALLAPDGLIAGADSRVGSGAIAAKRATLAAGAIAADGANIGDA